MTAAMTGVTRIGHRSSAWMAEVISGDGAREWSKGDGEIPGQRHVLKVIMALYEN